MISFGSTNPMPAPASKHRVVVEALVHRAALLLLGGFCATFALAAAVWNRDDRGLILGMVTVGYFVAAGILAFLAARRMKNWKPFAESARQFREDSACIHDIINSSGR
jgi:hypothetical protein